MAYRYRVSAEKRKEDGRWELVVWEPTRHGHRRGPTLGRGETFATKKAATLAKRDRLRWVQLVYMVGGAIGRNYHLIPETPALR